MYGKLIQFHFSRLFIVVTNEFWYIGRSTPVLAVLVYSSTRSTSDVEICRFDQLGLKRENVGHNKLLTFELFVIEFNFSSNFQNIKSASTPCIPRVWSNSWTSFHVIPVTITELWLRRRLKLMKNIWESIAQSTMNAPSREAAPPLTAPPQIAHFVLTVGISLFIFSFCTTFNFVGVYYFLPYSFCLANKENFSAAIVNICNNGTRECCRNSNNVSDNTLWQVAYEWALNLNIATCVIGIYPTAVLGAWGDLHNRKHAILVPVVGSAIGAILFFFVTIFAPDRL